MLGTLQCGDLQECKYLWLRIFGYKRNDLENMSTPIPHFTDIPHSVTTVHKTKIQKAKSAKQQEQVHQMIYGPLVQKKGKSSPQSKGWVCERNFVIYTLKE